jgi:hypothetical protein
MIFRLSLDLFLEQGWQHDGGSSGVFQPPQIIDFAVQRRCRRNHWVFQRETKIFGGQRHDALLIPDAS